MVCRVFARRFLLTLFMCFVSFLANSAEMPNSTFCNPMNLNYRFQDWNSGAREAADPCIVIYKNDYYLFASKSSGYWWSSDMKQWSFVNAEKVRPFTTWAPAAFVYNDELYLTVSTFGGLWKTSDPKNSKGWKPVNPKFKGGDPAVFVDDDERVYFYSNQRSHGISGCEVDPKTDFQPAGKVVPIIKPDPKVRGWEVKGDVKGEQWKTWAEGAWMTKHNGRYYLQYGAPCTEETYYANGAYVSDNPLGPFTYCMYSPVSYFPAGFSPGAGHGCLFKLKNGAYWRVDTAVIRKKHKWERRLNMFPAGFDDSGEMYSNCYLADHPQFLPGHKKDQQDHNLVGWMLLSYKKPTTASSSKKELPASNAVDENIRSWWSAETGDKGEWLQVDLKKVCNVYAIQTNFAEQDVKQKPAVRNDPHQYVVESSLDGSSWTVIIDKSKNDEDCPHDYVQLPSVVKARYFRVTNVNMPMQGVFAVRGFRLFGDAGGAPPEAVEGLTATRDKADARLVNLSWSDASDRTGVVIRFGTSPTSLYKSVTVREASTLTLQSLNKGISYYFAADAINENGISRNNMIIKE